MFQDEAHHRSPHVNAKLYIDGKEVNGFFPLSAGSIEKVKFLFTNGKSGDVEADDVIDDGRGTTNDVIGLEWRHGVRVEHESHRRDFDRWRHYLFSGKF